MARGTRKRARARKAGWRQWTADEAGKVLKAWRSSGLTLAAFARRRGLCPERIRWWRLRLGEEGSPSEEPVRLVPAVVTGLAPAAGDGVAVTVRAPGDVVIEIADPSAVPATWLTALVSGLARLAA